MIRLNILYPNRQDSRVDFDYYLTQHMPMSIRKFGPALRGISVEQGVNAGLPGTEPPYIAMAHLLFDSMTMFEEAFKPISEMLISDMSNYTDIEPVYQFSEIKIYK